MTAEEIREEMIRNYEAEYGEDTNQPEAEVEPTLEEAEADGYVPAHWYFHDNNPAYGPLTQVDSQIEEIKEMRAENLAILAERHEYAYLHGDQEEMWAIQAQMDWWDTVL